MARVKICGITRREDADLAHELGAWAIGFVLSPELPRACSPAVAAGITRTMQRKIQLVGVFANAKLDRVSELADTLGLSFLQFSGDEGPAYCLEAARRTGCKVIKGLAVESHEQLQDRERFHVELHLLAGVRPDEPWDLRLLKKQRTRTPFLLSGGIDPENVAELVELTRAWGVNIEGGVESAPGVKDPAKMAALFEAIAPPAEPEPEPEPEVDAVVLGDPDPVAPMDTPEDDNR